MTARKKLAFTLAEVLITLMILGVIATIVIPSTISRINKHQTEVKLKAAYSMINNVITRSIADNGSTSGWDFNLDTTTFAQQYIFPYLNISKICGYTITNAYLNNGQCFASQNRQYNFQTMNGAKNLYVSEFYQSAVLTNGMTIGVFPSSQGHWGKGVIFAVDLDGGKIGDSVIGKDVFFFNLVAYNTNSPYLMPGIDNYNRGYLKKSLIDLMGTEVRGSCNKESAGENERYQGNLCATAIMKNGWKIPDDYPIHF